MLETTSDAGFAGSYMVECYRPGLSEEQAEAAMLALHESAATSCRPVRCVASVVVPADDVVFHFFDASSERAVLDVCADAQLGIERIVRVVAVGGSGRDDLGGSRRGRDMRAGSCWRERRRAIPGRRSDVPFPSPL
jgi:hypothetical protein